MIGELGHFALALAFVLALAQTVLPLWGAARRDGRMMAAAGPLAHGHLLACAAAFGALLYVFAVNDTSVVNVVQNSHSAKPMLYKLAGAWGNHEGSMVLWVLILALCGGAVAGFGRDLPTALKARVLGVLGLVAAGFLLFILVTSNPFGRVWPPPADGQGLNPVLQDPGLAFHPPLLYLGYVGFAVTFAFAVAALLEGRVDAAWGRWVRPWALAAWSFLTLGIALGSWWAYYELGWGGYWFWDPVENASLLPWLAGTALLHSAVVVEKREALKVWTVLLALLAFGFSLLGTFLVRSGVLNSVHAFANDPERGVFILGLLVFYIGGAFALFAWRGPAMAPTGMFSPLSREGGLVLNNLLLCSAAAVVLVGTLWPMFADLLFDQKISVGPPFFNTAILPLTVPLVLAMAAGPLLSWKRARLWPVLERLWWAALGASRRAAAVPVPRRLARRPGAGLRRGDLADPGRAGRPRRPHRPVPPPGRRLEPRRRPAARRLGRGAGPCRARRHPAGHRRHGTGHRSSVRHAPRPERGAGRVSVAAGQGGGRDRPELVGPPRHRHRAARRRHRHRAASGTPLLSRGTLHHHRGRHPHRPVRRPVCRAGRGTGRRRRAAPAPQPAGTVDLAGRADHGAGRGDLAHRPPHPRGGAGFEARAGPGGEGMTATMTGASACP
jgi:ABC-type amino acid transport substrate-binding protein